MSGHRALSDMLSARAALLPLSASDGKGNRQQTSGGCPSEIAKVLLVETRCLKSSGETGFHRGARSPESAAMSADACSAAARFPRRCGCTSRRCAECVPSARGRPTSDCAAARIFRCRSPAGRRRNRRAYRRCLPARDHRSRSRIQAHRIDGSRAVPSPGACPCRDARIPIAENNCLARPTCYRGAGPVQSNGFEMISRFQDGPSSHMIEACHDRWVVQRFAKSNRQAFLPHELLHRLRLS